MIGYYVHHHGRGHQQRMESITAHLRTPVTVLSSLPPVPGPADWIRLPLDADRTPGDATAGGVLHWAPLHHAGLRSRMATIAAWIDRAAPRLVVVDVSVEVTLLCRLVGIPVVAMGMPGDRSDRAHRLGYDAATAILAPWAAEFASPGWPADWPQSWQDKTFYAGGISRFDGDPAPIRRPHAGPLRVAVLWGAGGGDSPAACSFPGDVVVRTATGGHDADAVFQLLSWCDVAVAHAGQNVVAELAATRTPAVVVAQDRPHQEQLATVRRLDRAGIAVGVAKMPTPEAWPDLLARARSLGGQGWARWSPGYGARAAAGFLDGLVADSEAGIHAEIQAAALRPAVND